MSRKYQSFLMFGRLGHTYTVNPFFFNQSYIVVFFDRGINVFLSIMIKRKSISGFESLTQMYLSASDLVLKRPFVSKWTVCPSVAVIVKSGVYLRLTAGSSYSTSDTSYLSSPIASATSSSKCDLNLP